MDRAQIALQILGQPHIQNMAYMALDGFGEGILNEPAMRWPTEHDYRVSFERVLSAVGFDHLEFRLGSGLKVNGRYSESRLGQRLGDMADASADIIDMLTVELALDPSRKDRRRAEVLLAT